MKKNILNFLLYKSKWFKCENINCIVYLSCCFGVCYGFDISIILISGGIPILNGNPIKPKPKFIYKY